MAHRTTVTIDMDKESMQRAATAVIEHLAIYPPSEDEHTTDFCLGMQILFDCLKATFPTLNITSK